jgi:hypothetical protein
MRDKQVEAVARAFFGAENERENWSHAPEQMRRHYRQAACAAIAEFKQQELALCLASPGSIVVHHPACGGRTHASRSS